MVAFRVYEESHVWVEVSRGFADGAHLYHHIYVSFIILEHAGYMYTHHPRLDERGYQ
jgi:hypothetical protein